MRRWHCCQVMIVLGAMLASAWSGELDPERLRRAVEHVVTPEFDALVDEGHGRELAEALTPRLSHLDPDIGEWFAAHLIRIGPPAVPALVAALDSGNDTLRWRAARTLGRMGPHAEGAVGALEAARTLGRMGPHAEGAVGALEKALADRKRHRPLTIVLALWRITGDPSKALAEVGPALDDPKRRGMAADVARALGPAARPLIPGLVRVALSDDHWSVRTPAIEALGEIGPGAVEAVPALVTVAKGTDSGLRQAAAQALGAIGPPAKDALPALGDAALDDWYATGTAAVRAMVRIDPAGRTVVPSLARALSAEPGRVRVAAAAALADMAPKAARATPQLIDALSESGFLSVREHAVRALAACARHDDGVVPALVRGLSHPTWRVRSGSAWALELIGPKARAAVPALTGALGDPRAAVRGAAADALGAIGPAASAAVPALADVVRRHELPPFVPQSCAEALGKIGPAAAKAAPTLRQALAFYDGLRADVCLSIVGALWRITREPAEPLAWLVKLLGHRHTSHEEFGLAVELLVAMGEPARQALPTLEEATRHRSERRRVAAAHAIWRLTGEAQVALPVLVAGLNSSEREVVSHAARAVGSMGDAARGAVPTLARLVESRDPGTRACLARAALGPLGMVAADAAPALERLLEGRIGPDYVTLAETLWRITRDGDRAVPPLIRALRARGTGEWDWQSAEVRQAAAQALGRVGPPAKQAISHLERARLDEYGNVRQAAVQALASIRGC